MLSVFYTKFEDRDFDLFFKNLLKKLPIEFQDKALRYVNRDDQMRSVTGRHLIAFVLKKHGYADDCLFHLKKSKYNKPFIDDMVDFNIAHSGEYVVCALNTKGKVGVDIEKIQPLDIEIFQDLFHKNEKKLFDINDSQSFYQMWTKKEAVCKAIGKGLGIDFSKIDTCTTNVICEGEAWNLHQLMIDAGYALHIAAKENFTPILFEQLELKSFMI